jgi:RNA polymerase sigma-70 factor, ECF subfamily
MRAMFMFIRQFKMKTLSKSDAELIRCGQHGDHAAMNELVDRYRSTILSQALYLLRDKDDAESATQDVCLRIFGGLEGFQSNALLSTWIYRITHNVCCSMLEKRRRELEKINAYASVVVTFEDAASAARQPEISFNELTDGLAQDEVQLLAMRFAEDREISDIACITGKSLSATKMRMYRAFEKVRTNYLALAS